MTADFERVRALTLAQIADDAAAGRVGPSRLREWRRDEPRTEAEAEAWLAAYPTAEAESRTAFEDDVDRYSPDDRFDRPNGGGSRWEAIL